jgi:hypothetical protein
MRKGRARRATQPTDDAADFFLQSLLPQRLCRGRISAAGVGGPCRLSALPP